MSEMSEGSASPACVRVRGLGFRKSTRKVDIRLPGKGNSNSQGERPVHQIISKITWIRTSRLSIKNSLAEGGEKMSEMSEGSASPDWERVQGLGFRI